MFESGGSHEQVVFCNDPASGLRAIIAIYSTALGPALGGTRFYPYASEADALADVLNLSRAMAYKAACAGLDLGGGKAVILGDPTVDKSEALLRAYGRFVQAVGGRYYTACDVGTYVEDMDVVARECSFVTGRSPAHGGAGDSSILTAFGVFQGMRAAAQVAWGSSTLRGRRVGISGVGKVGHHLVEHLLDDGASVVVTDVARDAVDRVRVVHPDVDAVEPDDLVGEPMDLYAPCALGGALSDDTVPRLQARIVCGAANNQASPTSRHREALLEERGVLYAPTFTSSTPAVSSRSPTRSRVTAKARARARSSRASTRRRCESSGWQGGRGSAAVGCRGPARRAPHGAGRRAPTGLAA